MKNAQLEVLKDLQAQQIKQEEILETLNYAEEYFSKYLKVLKIYANELDKGELPYFVGDYRSSIEYGVYADVIDVLVDYTKAFKVQKSLKNRILKTYKDFKEIESLSNRLVREY